MYVNTEMVIGTESGLLMVPDSAVVLRDDLPAVFVVTEGTAGLIRVETGARSERMIAISGPITETDTVVIEGNAFLEDGQSVEVVGRR
jgi:hypothetical protein